MNKIDFNYLRMNIATIYQGSLVFDKTEGDCFQIQDQETLDNVIVHWKNLFDGISLTENSISTIFSDFVPIYDSESSIKYQLFKNDNLTRSIASFYGIFDKHDPSIVKRKINNDNFILNFSDGNNVFNDFYCLRNQRRIHLKYIHEISNLIHYFIYGSFTPRGEIYGQFSRKIIDSESPIL